MTDNFKSYLFNFSYSFFGGGLKRILAYLKWFNEHGGACFALNHRLKGIEKTFPMNRYCFIQHNNIAKVFNYCPTFDRFIVDIGKIDLYYSYGIPLSRKVGRVNWLHIANVLTLVNAKKYISLKRSLELRLLGILMRNGMKYADIISAESLASLDLLSSPPHAKLIVSVNGSNEEITAYKQKLHKIETTENIAVAVGTCQYKCIDDVYKIYLHLLQSNPELRLVIAGIKEDVPAFIQKDNRVTLSGVLPQTEVCDLLQRAKYYLTATLIENSYNAASEGAFLAKEAYVSDIGPHRELLKNVKYKILNNLGTRVASLYVDSKDLIVSNLKSWDQVINEMLFEIR